MKRLLVVSLLSLLVAACVGAGVGYTVTASTAPPVPFDEEVSAAPGSGYVWVPGYWWWDGQQYLWIAGRWAYPPESGYIWVRSGWVLEGDQYVFVHGRWTRPGAVASYRYVHPRPRVRVVPGQSYRRVRRR